MHYYGYESFFEDVKSLIETIDFKPDTIIAVARGGLILGQFLAHHYDIRNLFALNCIAYDEQNQREEIEVFNIPDLQGAKKVLIVDEIVDSGKSLKKILEVLRHRYPECNFKSASLFYKEDAIIQPDFKVKPATGWIDFFWEVDLKA